MDKTIIQDYGKYLSKVNPEKGRRRAQEQEAKWAEERKKREEEKLTEAYQRELRERAEQAARERRKVEKATAAFNAEQAQKGTVSNTPDRRELRNRYNTRQNIAAHATGEMGVAQPMSAGDIALTEQLKQAADATRLKEMAQRRYGIAESALKGMGEAITAPFSGASILLDKLTGKDTLNDNGIIERNKFDTNQAKTAHDKAYGAGYLGGMALGSYALGGGSAAETTSAREAYQTAKDAAKAMYGLTEKQAVIPALKATAKALGANTLKELPKDLLLDTLPRTAEVMDDENMSTGERIGAIASNIGINALMNNITEIPSLVGIGRDAARSINIPKVGDETAEQILKNTPEKQTIEALGDTTKQIEDAVQRQTAEAQKVLKEAEPIEEWTRNQLKADTTIPRVEEPQVTEAPKPAESPAKSVSYKTAKNALNKDGYTITTIHTKKGNERFVVHDEDGNPVFPNKTFKTKEDAIKAYNEKAASVGDSAPTNNYTSSVEKAIDGYREALSWYDNKDIHPTSRKSIDRLKTALDKVAESAKAGDNAKFRENYDEFRKALTRVNENMAEKDGVDYFRDAFKGDINPKSEQNLMKLYDDAMYQKGLDDLDIGEDGFIIPKEDEDLPFNEIEYDKYGRVMLDDEGIPKRRRGVDVGSSIRNMDARFDDDVLTSEQKLSRVRGNTLERAGIDNEQELADIIPEEDFTYWTQPEKTTYAAAENRLATDWQGSLEKYTKDYTEKSASDIRSAEDVDAMMLMRNRLNDMARNATDPAEKRQLYAQSRKVALNLRKAGTEAGRNVQAFAKWTRTPEGAITSAQGFAEDLVDKALKKEPKLHNEIEDVSRQIESWLDDMDTAALTREEIEKMIREALLQRKRLRSKVSDGDIRKIADSIMNERQYADIQKELEFLSTGFEDIDADTLERVQDIFEQAQGLNFNSKERVDLENEAYKLLAMKISPKGGSFRDKLDAWRYLAMLANPTTHIKNITGNILFGQGMASAKNSLAALIEAGADRVSKLAGKGGIDDRTKAILTPGDKGLLDASAKDGLENAYRELAGNKYTSTGTAIDNAIPAFNTKTLGGKGLNKAADVNSGALNREDELAVMAKYRTSLAGFLKANGADESIFNATDTESKNLLESARAYAINQAKEAAFHQESATANALSQFSKNARNSDSKALKALGFASDVVIPFKKTPINILKSAIEYSPAEYVKVAADLKKLSKGRIKAADFIDDLSKATTGTVALGIGALLAHEGILKIGSSKSDEEQAFDTQTGRQNVAVKVGNKYIGLSELIPAAAPIILGGTIYESWKDSKGEENALNTIFSGMGAIAEGVTDMTMLSGIADTLNSIKYSDSDAAMWQKLLLNEGGNLASQLLPTLGRKINVTADDTKRSTYSDQTGAWKTVDQNAKYLQTKIPGLQQAGEAMKRSNIPALQAVGNRLALQPNIDVKGQVQDSPGVFGENGLAGRIANNFLSPVSLTEDSSTAYDDERRRLANATGETKVLPYIASSEAKIEGVGQLSPEQWTQYRQQRGQMREALATSLIDDKAYKKMSDPDKAELLKTVDSFTKAYSQAEYGKNMSSDNQKMADIYDKGGEKVLLDYLKVKKDLPDSKEATKIDAISKLSEEAQDAIIPALFDMSKTQKKQNMWEAAGEDGSNFIKEYQKSQAEAAKKAKQKEQKKKAKAAELGMSVDKAENLQQELASYGAINSQTTVKYYNHAKQTIPSLTPKGYTQKLKEIGGSDYKIDQKEMLTYLNKTGASQDEANKLWNAYGEWKSVPYLKKDGTWGKKNK